MMNFENMFETPTKAFIEKNAAALVEITLEEGVVSEVWARMEAVKLWAESVQEKLREHIVSNPPLDTFRTHGVKIEVSYRKTYEYSHDAAWAASKQQEQASAEQRKKREEFLKTLTSPLADPETGELIEPARILETKAIVKTTLPK